jgi:hypothetical protein
MSQSHKIITSPNFEKMWIQQDRRKFCIHTGRLSNNKDQVLELPSLLQINQRSKQNDIQCFLFT